MGRQMLDCGDVLDESQANGSVEGLFCEANKCEYCDRDS